ncbi:MAG: InlB B-repeat-containing protein [Bacteroidales bacterium]|nr:InlB B-repeat-containing protein [Bacteroidales bacterium]
MADFSRTLKLSSYSSVTFNYTVTETATATTYKLTTVKFANSRSTGITQKIYWYIWALLESPSKGTEVKQFVEKTVTLAKGTKSKSVSVNVSATIAKGTSSTPAWMFLRSDMDTVDYETNWTKEAYYSHPAAALASYAVAYNANGGAGAPAGQTKVYGRALTLSSTRPTRTNHRFLGWATSAAATTPQYQPGGSYTANAAVTLYAVWQQVYASPGLEITRSYRCDSAGTASDEGAYAAVEYGWSAYTIAQSATVRVTASVNGVSATATHTGSAGQQGTIGKASGTGKLVIDAQMAANASYVVSALVEDLTTIPSDVATSAHSAARGDSISTAYFPFDYLAGGHGAAVGTAANEEGTFRVQHNLKVLDDNGNVVLYVGKDGSVTVANPSAWRTALGI